MLRQRGCAADGGGQADARIQQGGPDGSVSAAGDSGNGETDFPVNILPCFQVVQGAERIGDEIALGIMSHCVAAGAIQEMIVAGVLLGPLSRGVESDGDEAGAREHLAYELVVISGLG